MNATNQTSPGRAPRHWRRTGLLYLGLVGLPGVGVGVIIQAGRDLTPPISVGGRWTVSAAPVAGADLPELTSPPSAPGQHPLVIVQSGVRLDVSLGGNGLATTTGSLEGNRMQATLGAGGKAVAADRPQVPPPRRQDRARRHRHLARGHPGAVHRRVADDPPPPYLRRRPRHPGGREPIHRTGLTPGRPAIGRDPC